jgi:hypothetical protein
MAEGVPPPICSCSTPSASFTPTANHHDQHGFVTVITAKVKSYEKVASIIVAGVLAACAQKLGYEPIDAYSPGRLNTINVDELLRDIELNRVPIVTTFQSASWRSGSAASQGPADSTDLAQAATVPAAAAG